MRFEPDGSISEPLADSGFYDGYDLSDAEDDLRERGYVCVDPGRAGHSNILAIYRHPTTGVQWALSAL